MGEDEVVVEAAKRQYTINLRDSEQVNNSTNVTRKIENLTIGESCGSIWYL